jgi:hypothetical protein
LNRTCFVLEANITNFSGTVLNKKAELNWSVTNNNVIDYFKIESSYDGAHFSTLQKISSSSPELSALDYKFTDDLLENKSGNVYYRLKMVDNHNKVSLSKTIRLSVNENWKVSIFPNPVTDNMQISVYAPSNENVDVAIYDASGRLMRQMNTNVSKGNSKINLVHFQNWPTGIYSVKVISGKNVFVDKFVIQK